MAARFAPDAVLVQTNLTGVLADIQDDPDSPDANWLTATDTSANTELGASYGLPDRPLKTGAGLQEFRVLVRKAGGINDPTVSVELYEAGVFIANVVASQALTSTTGVVLSGTWDASLLSNPDGSGVEVRVVGTAPGGANADRSTVEVGAVEWNATLEAVLGSANLPSSGTTTVAGTVFGQDSYFITMGFGDDDVTYEGVIQVFAVTTELTSTATATSESDVTSFGTAVTTGTASASVTAYLAQFAASAVSATGGITAEGLVFSGDYNITMGFGSNPQFYQGDFPPTADTRASSSLSVVGTRTQFDTVTLASDGSSLIVGKAASFASPAASGNALVVATALAISGGSVTTSASATLSSQGIRGNFGESMLSASSSLTVSPSVESYGAVLSSGTATASGASDVSAYGVTASSGVAEIVADAYATVPVAIWLTSEAVFEPRISLADMYADAYLNADGYAMAYASASLNAAASTLQVSVARSFGGASLSASSEMSPSGYATATSSASLSAEAGVAALRKIKLRSDAVCVATAWPPTVHVGDDSAGVSETQYSLHQYDWQVRHAGVIHKTLVNA